ncbi:hypothetical protein pipiens_002681 [Culex pipiens pipiens]|uniref:Pupal cuticle protein n=1 Tax=Culex pipiens pipiens TaxID=38569 RepID=A0ABD1DBM3_CULPP|nr:larval cuticle protein A2B-like [Culex pipiens pallens]
MAFKFIALTTLLAAIAVGALPQHGHASSYQSIQLHTAQHHVAPVHHVAAVHALPVHHAIVKGVEHHAPANYEFAYSVHDGHTGDIKSQHESRHGDEVHGQYSLLDADGHQRIVDYHADHHNGFTATVRREPTGVKIAQPVAKVIAQPVHAYAHHVAAPVIQATHHYAPVAYHSAPLAYHGGHGGHATSHISVQHY